MSEHNKELVSFLEEMYAEMKANLHNYENSYMNFSDVPGKYIGVAIYRHYLSKLEPILGKS